MAWDTSDRINLLVDEVKSLILANAATLGGILGVLERDEEPAIPAAEGRLPWAYVIPIMEGGDHLECTIDASAVRHQFPVTIVGYYNEADIGVDAVRAVRGYGYTTFDLLRQHDCGVLGPTGGLVSGDLDVGYWIAVDTVVHYFILRCEFKALF